MENDIEKSELERTWELERTYEKAKGAYGKLISSRSELIYKELASSSPDQKKIHIWENEQGDLMHQRENVYSLNKEQLETLIAQLLNSK